MGTASSVARHQLCGRLIAQAYDRDDHHEPEHVASAEEVGLESRKAEAEQPDLKEQHVQGGIGAIGGGANVIEERLDEYPDHRNREADQTGHHGDVEESIMRIAGAIAPGFEVGPIGYQLGRSPERLESETDHRSFRNVVERKAPNLVAAGEG